MFLAYYDAKSMPMHHNGICLARGVLLEHPCHATDPYWHISMPLVMLVMTWQPYSFEMAVSSSHKRPYLRQKYVRRIITVSRIVLLHCKPPLTASSALCRSEGVQRSNSAPWHAECRQSALAHDLQDRLQPGRTSQHAELLAWLEQHALAACPACAGVAVLSCDSAETHCARAAGVQPG